MRPLFCVFARPPTPGASKTRLIPAVGPEGAARLAAAFYRDVRAALDALGDVDVVIATTGPPDGLSAAESGEWWLQGDGDLGARVERILRRGLSSASWVVAIGADSPGVPPDTLRALVEAQRTHGAAMVPAEDGGFVALAVSRMPEGGLAGLPWSVSTTGDAVAARVQALGMSLCLLPGWWDVDEPGDLVRLAQLCDVHPERLTHTAPLLRSLLGA